MHSWALPSLTFAFALINIWLSKGPRFPSCDPHFGVVCLNWAWFTFNIKICLTEVRECDGEDGRAVD